MIEIQPIRSEGAYEGAMKIIEYLMSAECPSLCDARLSKSDALDLISILVKHYEDEHHRISEPSPWHKWPEEKPEDVTMDDQIITWDFEYNNYEFCNYDIETEIWYAHYGLEDYVIIHPTLWMYPPEPPEEK